MQTNLISATQHINLDGVNEMIKTEVVELTPTLAQKLLEKNSSNRPVSKATVARYAQAIIRGEWQLNGEPIIIFSDGNIGNGQHRCLAVLMSGISINTVIMYGIDPNTFGTVDSGRNRKANEILAINGEVNTVALSSAARALLTTKLTKTEANRITNLQIEKCVEDHPHLRYWVKKYIATRAKIFPSSVCGYFAIASEKYGFEKLDKFFDQISTGANIHEDDPAFVLRERFIAQTKSSRLSALASQAFIVKAINAHLLGKKMKLLRVLECEQMPTII